MNKKLKKTLQCTMCAVLSFGMVVCNSSFVEAKKIKKQESVYVNAAADGSVSKITVSDWLKGANETTGTINDISDLKNISNVKGDETFKQNGKDVDWSGAGKDIYYQGESDEKLPVDMKITYKLDGKEIAAKDMLGKSGKVEIHVSYTNKSSRKKKIDGKETTIYTPFVMVTAMVLSSDHFENVEVDNARVVNDGDNQMIIGMGVPGMAENLDLSDDMADKIPSDFTVTADTKDFTIGNTFTYGSASLLNDLDLDDVDELDDLEEKLNDLTDASDKLVDGSDDLYDNLKLFDSKMGELNTSVKKFQKEGVNRLANGISTLAKGAPTLVKGVTDYANGVTTFAKGTTSYVDGAAKITNGCALLYKSVKDIPTQIQSFDTGLKTYTGSVDKLGSKQNVTALKSGAKAVSDGVTSLNTNLVSLEKTYETTDLLLKKLKATGADATTVATLEQVLAGQKQAIQAMKQATSTTGDLKVGAEKVSGSVATVMDSLDKLSANSSTLTEASTKLKTSMPTLVSSVKTLKEGGDTLAKNNKKLKGASKKLVKSGKTLKKSIKTVGSGVKKLDKGSKSLKSATGKLSTGVGKLDTASGKLKDGSKKLADGMSEFNKDGIEKINDTYEDDVKGLIDRLKAVCEVGKDYKSFSGLHGSMNGEVKFVIETAAIEKED